MQLRSAVVVLRFRNGYPETLVEAHIHSYLGPPQVRELQANAAIRFNLEVKPEPKLKSSKSKGQEVAHRVPPFRWRATNGRGTAGRAS
jgi:hypothetical protein